MPLVSASQPVIDFSISFSPRRGSKIWISGLFCMWFACPAVLKAGCSKYHQAVHCTSPEEECSTFLWLFVHMTWVFHASLDYWGPTHIHIPFSNMAESSIEITSYKIDPYMKQFFDVLRDLVIEVFLAALSEIATVWGICANECQILPMWSNLNIVKWVQEGVFAQQYQLLRVRNQLRADSRSQCHWAFVCQSGLLSYLATGLLF